jgi:hypothetical protein
VVSEETVASEEAVACGQAWTSEEVRGPEDPGERPEPFVARERAVARSWFRRTEAPPKWRPVSTEVLGNVTPNAERSVWKTKSSPVTSQ